MLERVGSLTSVGPETTWLDYGCGTGGLVLTCTSMASPVLWGPSREGAFSGSLTQASQCSNQTISTAPREASMS